MQYVIYYDPSTFAMYTVYGICILSWVICTGIEICKWSEHIVIFFKCFLSKMDLEILGQNPINFPHKPLEGNPQKPYANMSGPFQKLAALWIFQNLDPRRMPNDSYCLLWVFCMSCSNFHDFHSGLCAPKEGREALPWKDVQELTGLY